MKIFLFALLVTVALLLGSNTTISAQPTAVAPAGSGTQADPYQIATLANLYWISASDAEVPSPTQAIRWTKYYIQTANIDASSTATWFPNGSGGYYGWSPIGDALNDFTGHYNGMSFTIRGLRIYRNNQDFIGLFRAIGAGAVISNIGLINILIRGHYNVGGLSGRMTNGTVTNCYTTGYISATLVVGGMVGLMESGTITNAYSGVSMSDGWYNAAERAGGMVGEMVSGTITNAYAIGEINNFDPGNGLITPFINKAGAGNEGGLIGKNTSGIVNNCFWDTDLSGQSSSYGGTGKTAIEMRTQSTFTGWDFTPVTGQWQIASAGSGYRYCPCLQGFTYDVPFTTPAVNPLPGLIWSYSGGDGTSGNPFQIANLTDLENLGYQFYDWAYYFIQTENIDATATSDWYNGLGFSPIGKDQVTVTEPSALFTGNYNGNYHTITGLYINRPETYDIGLFGYVGSSGSISNVGLVNVNITGKENVGGLVGYFDAANGSITNSYVTGHVTAQNDVGGLAGEIRDGTVTNAYSTANVTGEWGEWGVGGLVGAAWDNITNAYSTGLVTGGVTNEGGLIGWQYYITLVNSFWDTQTSGRNISAKGTGKNTSEMKLQSTFTGWDFAANTGKWQIKASPPGYYKSYPYLQGFTYDEPAASPVVNPIPGLTDLFYSGGIGTPENPYQIATLADLQYLSEHSDDWAKYFIQTTNIDAAATSGWNTGLGFSPIGNETIKFTGSYNGNGHTIDGLYINRPLQDYIGLFGYINTSGSISNLGLTNITITGKNFVGGLSGLTDLGTFTNVYASGNASVTGSSYVGGLVGIMFGSGTLTSAYSTGNVTGNDNVGGLVGFIWNNGNVTNAYSSASVTGAEYVGGLVGSTYSGNVTNAYSSASVAGSSYVGGLVGWNPFASVVNSFWDTQTSGQATSAGGEGITTTEMKNVFTYITNCWDFQAETGNGNNDYWGIDASSNDGYPFLSFQGFTNTATYPSTITIGTTTSPTCGCSISDGVLSASMDVTIHVDEIYTALASGNLTIQASNDIIINTAIEPALTEARTLTLKAGGNISMAASVSLTPSTEFALNIIIWSDSDANNDGSILLNDPTTITTKGGHLWIGGGSGSAAWYGLTVGNGYAKSTAGDAVALSSATISTSGGDIEIKGESTATATGSDGIFISNGSMNAGSGNISLYGIGGQATVAGADCDGIVVNGPITTTYGNITLTGSSTAEQWTEGISIPNSNIISSTSGNISLITNIFWMETTARIGSSGNLTLKPFTNGSTIGVAGGAGTLSLPTAYFTTNFVDGFSGITIGSDTTGNIGIKAIPFNDPVTFNAAGNLNLENDIDLAGQTITLGNEITLNEASGRFYGTTGDITTTRNLSNISSLNVAGLGATLTTTTDMGATTITRSHTNQSWGGNNSVLRYYDITPTNNTGLNATMVFNYNDAELKSLTESKLLLFKSTNSGTTYSCEGGTVNTTANTITLAGINDFSRWMAAEILTLTWNGAGSDFNTAANWTPNATPSAFYNITIPDLATDPIVNQAPATPAVCNDLAIASGAVLTIAPGKSLTVNGTLTNNAENTGLVIKSTADGAGSLIHNNAGVPGTMERYIAAANWDEWKDGWHNLSSPVVSQTISPEFVHGFDLGAEDFYKWDEPTNMWVNIKNEGGTAWTEGFETAFVVGRGYLAAYSSLVTKNFTGNLNVADVTVSGLTISAGKNKSWHLLGNPFTGALTWDASVDWSLVNIGGVAKIWNEAIQGYSDLTSSPSTVIPATNGFMVQVSSGTGSLKLPAAKRAHSSQGFYKSSVPHLQLVARNTTVGNAQESNIVFNPDATTSFDLMYDGEFLAGHGPQFYSVAGNEKLSTNSLPEFSEETVIPFNFIKNEGTNFTIEATGIETLEPAATVFLNDNKLGIKHNLSENPVYAFTSTDGDAPARFELHFGSVGINETPAAQTVQAWYYCRTLNVKTSEGLTNIDVFNLKGQNLQNFELQGNGLQSVTINLPAGVYFARLVNGGTLKTVKFIVQ